MNRYQEMNPLLWHRKQLGLALLILLALVSAYELAPGATANLFVLVKVPATEAHGSTVSMSASVSASTYCITLKPAFWPTAKKYFSRLPISPAFQRIQFMK